MSPLCQLQMTLPWKASAAEMAIRYGANISVLDWRERLVLTEHRYMQEDLKLGLSFLISVAELAGVATPLARSFLAIGGAICGEDFLNNGRTLQNLGFAGLDRQRLQTLLRRGFD